MIQLKCYEPAGTTVHLTAQTLLRHLLILGTTGSGKTSGAVNPILQQLVSYRGGDLAKKCGLLILDPKGDGAIGRVAAMAREAGRTADLITLGPGGNAGLDLLGGFTRLDQVQEYTRLFMVGTMGMGPQNIYFEEVRTGLISSALTIMLAGGAPVSLSDTLDFMVSWWFHGDKAAIRGRLATLEKVLESDTLTETSRRRLKLAHREATLWENMDERSKSIHQSSLRNILRPLLATASTCYFDLSGRIVFEPRQALEGKIMVVSCNAQTDPELAGMLFKIIKKRFFESLQARGEIHPERDRLCFLVCDEFGLIAEKEDVENMSTCRSRGCGVILATQTVAAIEDRIGVHHRCALLANVNSYVFMQSRADLISDSLAYLTMGTQPRPADPARESGGRILVEDPTQRPPAQLPVCEMGALASLPAHHAYVCLADGYRTLAPVWLEPKFFESPTMDTILQTQPDDLAQAVNKVLGRQEPATAPQKTNPVERLREHIKATGRREHLTPDVVELACSLFEQHCLPKRASLIEAIQAAVGPLAGIEAVPSCWLPGLLSWLSSRHPMAEYVNAVVCDEGVLCLELRAMPSRELVAPMFNSSVNRHLYPNLWRPLKRPHFIAMLRAYPELRPVLLQLGERKGK